MNGAPEPPRFANRSPYFLAALMLAAGTMHLVQPDIYRPAMPPYLFPRHHLEIIYLTGVLELLAGLGLIIPRLRTAAAWGCVAFFIAILPANVHMATERIPIGGMDLPAILWLRVALQLPLIYWAWTIATHGKPEPASDPL